MAKVTKRQLREKFLQRIPTCCDDYTSALIKQLVVESGNSGEVQLPRSIEESGIELNDFADKLAVNVRLNWFALYYFDIVLNYFKSRNIKNCIEKDRYELRKLIRHILWCRMKEKKIRRVDDFSNDDTLLVFKLHTEIEHELRKALDIKFSQPVSVLWQCQKEYSMEELNEYFEEKFKQNIINIIWDCLQIEKDEEEKKREGYQYLCSNIKDKIWEAIKDPYDEIRKDNKAIINTIRLIESSIPVGNEKDHILLAFVFIVVLERLLYIKQNIKKSGAFVYLLKNKDNTLLQELYNGEGSHPALSINIKELIYAFSHKENLQTDTDNHHRNILHDIITILFIGKLDEYMFVQSLKSYIYTIIRSHIKNQTVYEISEKDDEINELPDIEAPTYEEHYISLHDLVWECPVMSSSFQGFLQYLTEFITRASPQRKAPELKQRILFDRISDYELYEEFKDNPEPMYNFKNIKNIKTIRNRIRKSLRNNASLLMDREKCMTPLTKIITDHLNVIENNILKEMTRVPLFESTNIQTKSLILESPDYVTKMAQFSYLFKVMQQTKLLFGDPGFAADFWEEVMPDIPAIKNNKEIILREFRAY